MKKIVRMALFFAFVIAIGISSIGTINYNVKSNKSGFLADSALDVPEGEYDPFNSNAWTYDDNRAGGYEGNGTAESPWEINSAEQLAFMAYRINHGFDNNDYFILKNDIDLSKYYWIPIGFGSPINYMTNPIFGGNFNGNHKKITGLYIGNPDENNLKNAKLQYAGLFGYVAGNDAQIYDLDLECYIQNSENSQMYTAGLIGYGTGDITITNCKITGTISAVNTDNIGAITQEEMFSTSGLIGKYNNEWDSYLKIKNCINMAAVTAKNGKDASGNYGNASYCSIAGLAGCIKNLFTHFSNAYVILENSFNAGKIDGNFTGSSGGNITAGGLVGYFNNNGTAFNLRVKNCFNLGDINLTCTSLMSFAGGLLGWCCSTGLENSYSTGNISLSGLTQCAGGLAGAHGFEFNINNCYSTGNLNAEIGTPDLGGIIGSSSGPSSGIIINNTYFNKTAKHTYNNGNSQIIPPQAIGDWPNIMEEAGYSEIYIKSQEFINELNLNKGSNSEWVWTNDFPGLKDVITMTDHIIFHFCYDDNNIDYGPDMYVLQLGENSTFPSQPVRGGYSFHGWWTYPQGAGEKLESGGPKDRSINNLYAYWRTDDYIPYDFIIEFYDKDGKIDGISDIDIPFHVGDKVYKEINNKIETAIDKLNLSFKFSHFEIGNDKIEITDETTAGEFEQYKNSEGKIIIKAVYVQQFSLSFKSDDNLTIQNRALVIIHVEGKGEGFYRFFENLPYDKGTKIEIEIIPLPGKAVESVKLKTSDGEINLGAERNFMLLSDTGIIIEMSDKTANIELILKIDENLPSELMPYTQNPQSIFNGTETNAGKVLTNLNDIYRLTGWEIFINDELIEYKFEPDYLDINNNILALNIAKIIENSGFDINEINTITLKALWKKKTGIEIIYINGSNSGMGNVSIYFNDNLITDISQMQEGSVLKLELKASPYYRYISDNCYVNEIQNRFENGLKSINLDGILKVYVDFKPVSYTVTSTNKNAKPQSDTAKIDDNIIIDLTVGLGSKIGSFTLSINEQPVNADSVKIVGDSLVISLNKEFMNAYIKATDESIILDIDYSTNLSGLLIGIIGASGALIAASIVLIILFLLALKKKKAQLKKAEQETKIGMAKLTAAERIQKIRDED